MSCEWGLKGDWEKVIRSIEAISDIYDDVNKVISLRRDVRLRTEGINGRLRPNELILDAGAGNGAFSRVVLQVRPEVRGVVMLDASLKMLKSAEKGLDSSRTEKVLGIFENLPFRKGCFDAVVMGFSLRDARDMQEAISEIARALRQGGKLIVVDLGKPENKLKSSIIALYWLVVAPAMATFRFGKKGLHVSTIYSTYKRHPSNSQLQELLSQSFSKVDIRKKMLEGVVIAFSEDPKPNISYDPYR